MAGGAIHAATSLPLNIPSRASQLYRYAGKMRSKAFPAALSPATAVAWPLSLLHLLPRLLPFALFRTMGPLLLDR